MLRMNTRSSCELIIVARSPSKRAFADHARIVRQNRDARFRFALQKTQHQFIDQRRLPRAARPGKTNDLAPFDVRSSMFGVFFRIRDVALPFARSSSIAVNSRASSDPHC